MLVLDSDAGPASTEMTVLVGSCDRYAAIWPAFLDLFWRHWPDCPFPVAIGSNFERCDNPRVDTVLVGEDVSWADSMGKMLAAVSSPYVLLFMDDYMVHERIDTQRVIALLGVLEEMGGNYMRLRRAEKGTSPVVGRDDLREILPGTPYRASLDVAIWSRLALRDLLVVGETPWAMEVHGSERASSLPGFYAPTTDVVHRFHILEKGKLQRRAAPFLEGYGIRPPEGFETRTKTEDARARLRTEVSRAARRLRVEGPLRKVMQAMAHGGRHPSSPGGQR